MTGINYPVTSYDLGYRLGPGINRSPDIEHTANLLVLYGIVFLNLYIGSPFFWGFPMGSLFPLTALVVNLGSLFFYFVSLWDHHSICGVSIVMGIPFIAAWSFFMENPKI